VLYHPKIVESFKSNRWFIPCEGSTTPEDLISLIASHLELSGDKLFERIILLFEAQRTALVLDNLETPWEAAETRFEIENILSRLTAIKTLTVLVTMRGSERPSGIAWTRPFIAPLTPLDMAAARLTFIAISDSQKDDPYIEQLLIELDNLPLAINLMGNLAQSETPEVLLKRWYSENTTMLTRCPEHRLSSLQISISISLDGPRMRRNPDANLLLRILALLPQGSKDLEEIAPVIPNVRKAAAVLRQVGLAYVDGIGALRVLAPVRRFIVANYPPDLSSWKFVQKHFENLATMSSEIERGMDGLTIVERLSPQTSNMQAVFEHSLDIDGADFPTAIQAAIDLTDLFKYTGLGSLTTLIKASQKAEAIGNTALLADCIRSQAEIYYSRSSPELATAGFEKALSLYTELGGHLPEQGRCTMMLGIVISQAGNYREAIVYIEHAIELHRRGGDVIGEVSKRALVSSQILLHSHFVGRLSGSPCTGRHLATRILSCY
jgi:tetratricopeptide (TPR) repeat protein